MSGHLKSYAAPKSWTLLRKVNKFATLQKPGAHPHERSQPVSLLLKQRGVAKTTREANKIVQSGVIKVDGRIVKDHRRSVGFMDSIQVGDSLLRCTIDQKGRLMFNDLSTDESKKKVCQILQKKVVPKNKVQLSLLGGRTLLVDKNNYAIGDSLVIEVPNQKVLEHLPLTAGATVFLLSGRHMGITAQVISIEGSKVRCKKDKQEFDTLKEFAFVIGKDKPVIKL